MNTDDSVTNFLDTELVPLQAEAVAPADISYPLSFDFQVYTDGINRGAFNGVPYLMPKTPSLLTALTVGAEYANNSAVYGPHGNGLIAPHLQNIQLVVNNLDAGLHPFHLHGHVFQIVARGDGIYNESVNIINETQLNPVRRDTVHIPAESFAVIRFRADNPAVWFFHCHIEWHLEGGLAVQIIEGPEVMADRVKPPQQMIDNCAALGWSTSGNAAGKQGLDLKGAPANVDLIYDGFTAKGKGAMAACIISALLGMGTIVWYAQGQVSPAAHAKKEEEKPEVEEPTQ
jgi:iron transport multicopper oxidase